MQVVCFFSTLFHWDWTSEGVICYIAVGHNTADCLTQNTEATVSVSLRKERQKLFTNVKMTKTDALQRNRSLWLHFISTISGLTRNMRGTTLSGTMFWWLYGFEEHPCEFQDMGFFLWDTVLQPGSMPHLSSVVNPMVVDPAMTCRQIILQVRRIM